MNYLKLFEITVIVVIIVDISGFVDSIKVFIGKLLNITNVRLKPLDCSFCVTFWMSMGYLIYTNELSLTTLMVSLLMSVMTPTIQDLIYLIRDILGFILLKISKLLK